MMHSLQLNQLAERFKQVRRQTEAICRPLLPEDTVVQPIVDVSPPKWHLAHTSWFFEVFILQPYFPQYAVFNPVYNFLFNSYYNSIGSRVQRDQRGTLTRPPLAEIYQYRTYVDEHVSKFISDYSDTITPEIIPLLELGLHHEQQHQELLLTDIKYILSTNPLLPAYQEPPQPIIQAGLPNSQFLPVPEGFYNIGYSGDGFCFDNELKSHKIWLPAFEIQNRLVTNGEYLDFIQAGGYQDFRHWLGEGFELVQQANWQAPLYWLQQENEWFRFTLHGLQKLDLDAPVTHISFYEAAAYAAWAGKRLLTEFEWEAASQVYPPEATAGNFQDSGLYDVWALTDLSADKCYQLFGDVWEWTNSAYMPYPGFDTAPGALGEYNGKFMINQMVLRGGSCATPASHIRTTYRNFFHPDKRWQFSGIRLANK